MHILRNIGLILFSAALATRAQAADNGECATPEAMTAKLKAENQRSIATAELLTDAKELFGIVLTMSADRRVGYILKGDRPTDERSSQICVYKRLADIRLFDARQPGPPPGALLKAPESEALQRCDELAGRGVFQRGACGSLNTILRKIEGSGERVVLQGFMVEKDHAGRYQPNGTLATVTGRIGGSIKDFRDNPALGILGGIMFSSLPDGASVLNATLVFVDYTEYGLTLLAGPGR